jgi:outer membrane protein
MNLTYKKIFHVIAYIFIIGNFYPIYAGENSHSGNENKILSFTIFIDRIEKSLPEIKSNDIDVMTAENNIRQSKASSDVSLTGSGKYSSTNQNMLPMSTQKYDDKETSFSIGAGKRITTTGTDVNTSLGYTKNDYSGTSISAESYVPSASIKISQPLLYNFLGKVDKYAEKNSVMKAKIAKIEQLENNKSVLNAYKKLYFQWQIYIKIIEDIKTSISNSELQREQVARNLRAGISEDDDYQRASASVLSYKRQYQEYLTSLNNIEHQLSLYIDIANSKPDEKDFSFYNSEASDSGYDYINFDKTRSFKIIDLSLKNLDYAKGVYENKLLPTFDVYAGITQKNLSSSSSDSYQSLPDRDYNIGVEFSYKLGNNEAESNLEKIKIQVQSLKYEYETTFNTYKKSLLKLQESSTGTKDQIRTIDEILKTLHQQLKTENRKYSQGRLALSYIIDTQNSIAAYNISSLNLKYQLISYYIDYMDAIN